MKTKNLNLQKVESKKTGSKDKLVKIKMIDSTISIMRCGGGKACNEPHK